MIESAQGLFGPIDPEAVTTFDVGRGSSLTPTGPFAAIAIERSVDRMLDYAVPQRLVTSVQVGQRVRVPLGRGNKPAYGYVIGLNETTAFADPAKIKSLLSIDDQRVLVPPTLMALAVWMARYYITPLGQVLESVIPSAVKKRTGIGYLSIVRLAMPREQVQELLEKTKAAKRRAVLARLLQVEPDQSVELLRLASEAGVKPAAVRKLIAIGVITVQSKVDLPGLTADFEPSAATEQPIEMNEDQRRAFEEMLPRLVGTSSSDANAQASTVLAGPLLSSPPEYRGREQRFSVNLLMGVTGSGKTEVYLRCLKQVVDQGRQAIVLVPEIALTPQTVRRFTARFPRVAVLHSGLTASQRHKYWQQIATGQAQVVVGARSAIFAPVPNLGAIVVDEEHESSYKQDQSPRYHARDVAIKRAQLEKVPIILGSATPSLEMYHRAGISMSDFEFRNADLNGAKKNAGDQIIASSAQPEIQNLKSEISPYHLLTLPRRVRGLALPHVELIDMKQEMRFRQGVNLFSQRLEYLLTNTLAQGQQAIILLNRRGYSNYVHCVSCQHLMQCKYCDKTMTYHRSAGPHELSAKNEISAHSGQLHCHYCLAVSPLPTACPKCGKKLSLFGLGTQRAEEEIKKKFPEMIFARVDSDTMRSSKDYEALLGRFARREVQVLLGTQMIAKGLDYPNVTLVGVLSGDTALALPDFRAAERTFQLITQVAGRAGRGDLPGRVVLQTFLPDDPAIQFAIKQDYEGFAAKEFVSRREVGLPPFGRLVRIVMRDEDAERLQRMAEELAAEFAAAIAMQGNAVQMKGPMPCAVGRISGYFRHQILLSATTPTPLQRVLATVRKGKRLTQSERVAVDVDPVSLL